MKFWIKIQNFISSTLNGIKFIDYKVQPYETSINKTINVKGRQPTKL